MKKMVLALLLALLPSLAVAQQFPVIQDMSVIGRIGSPAHDGGSGPSQAIPFLNFNSLLGNHVLPGTYAADPQFGMKCNGVDDDSAALQLAVNTADANLAWPVYVPEGTCPLAHNVYLNKFGAPGTLTVPGMKLVGQGRGVTILDTRVANDYAISVNPAWKAAHQAAFGAVPGSAGALPSNTYYLEITENDGLGHEISVTLPKSFSIGSTGSLSIALPALPSGYSYNLYCDTVNNPVAHYCGYGAGPGNATAVAGGQTIVINSVGTAHTIPTALQAVWQEASISNLSITNSTGATNASGIEYFKVGYSDLTNVYMHGLTGDGFGVQAYTGDVDGSFNIGVHNSKFDTIAGTCVNAAGNVLELTSFTVDDLTAFNICGTLPTNLNTPVTISVINNSSSSIVTTSGSHSLLAGDQVALSVSGMTLSATWYRVCGSVTGNRFNLCDLSGNQIDTTSLGSFVSGTVSLSWRPPQIAGGVLTGGGGCLAWTGLLGTLRNTNFTQCNNFSFYATEVGSSDNLTIENVDFENTAGVGAYIAGLAGGTLKNFECLSTVGDGSTIACVQIGTGMASGGVQNFLVDVGKVRTNVSPAVGFEQFQNTNIGATYQDTNRVRNITWQSFDASGQTRFSGYVFEPIPGTVQASISAQNTVKLVPLGYGSCLPIHPKSPGEWVCYHVPSVGITGTVTGGLSANTAYNCYAGNSAATSNPYSIGFTCNAHATALNEGYAVDSTDSTKSFVLKATTDGSGNFQSSGAQSSWYPPAGGSVALGTGTPNGVAVYVNGTNVGSTAAGTNGQFLTGVTSNLPAWVTMSGDATIANTGAITLATVNTNTGAFGDATHCVTVTNNGKGLTTAVSSAVCAPAITSITGLAAGVATAAAAGLAGTGNLVASISPAITTPILSGTITGTYTLGGTPTGTNLIGTATGLTAGNATNAVNTGITDDSATNATMFPTWVTANTGNLPQKTSSTKLTFNPSTGALSSPVHIPTIAAATGWGLDFSNAPGLVVSGSSSATLATGSGLVLLVDTTVSGQSGLYLIGGSLTASAALIAGGSDFVAPTITPAANKYSVGFDGTNWRVYNGNASAVTFNTGLIRVRNTD